MKYRFRSSQLSTLLDGCGKVRDKLEWKDLDKISDAHIKLAIKVFNATRGFTPYSWNSLDMHAGVEHEPEAVRMLDKLRNTNYYEEYKRVRDAKKPFDKYNEYTTGTRDVGGDFETLDTKVHAYRSAADFLSGWQNLLVQSDVRVLILHTTAQPACKKVYQATQNCTEP